MIVDIIYGVSSSIIFSGCKLSLPILFSSLLQELAPSDVAWISMVLRRRVCAYTARCDADGIRIQLVLRQDGTVCQTACAVECDSRPAGPPVRSGRRACGEVQVVLGVVAATYSTPAMLGPHHGTLYHRHLSCWSAHTRKRVTVRARRSHCGQCRVT